MNQGRRVTVVVGSLLAAWLALVALAAADPIDEYLMAEMARRRIPGLALAVVQNGVVVKMQGYGSYKMVTGSETRYYTFWLTADGRVADFWSSTE